MITSNGKEDSQADRELLELAAKAAGVERALMDNGEPFYIGVSTSHAWNPLEYDGDALRLAACLRIGIAFSPIDGATTAYRDRKYQQVGCYEPASHDLEATRRAITRAAAEIGMAMP